jgi:hypothetical protein
LIDGSFSIGQVVNVESNMPNAPLCAFFKMKVATSSIHADCTLDDSVLIAVLFVTRDLLDKGSWQVFGSRLSKLKLSDYVDLEELRRNGYIGMQIIGSGIINKMMEAYFALYPWDGFSNPDYLDSLLVSIDRKPSNLILKRKDDS